MSHASELIKTDILAYLKQHEHKELLRMLTCGSVDDGKSTLIGRLLFDSKLVYEDQLAAVTADSKKHGTTGGFDPALLTDGLKAEREQGITIDVAYRYFSTAKRKFIIADTPGHEQYTRNMATGASTADLAIILIDARHGVLTQTRRHSFIVSLLGIKHVVVAINKMDLVDYSEQVFDEIRGAYSDFVADLGIPDVRFVPLSALNGDNVVDKSENLPWYEGATLMHILEHVHIASDRNLSCFRYPVQYVNRPDATFRGYCGSVASGRVRLGDEVVVLPSGRTSTVAGIVTYDGALEEAHAPMAVTLTLADEIDVSRGDMIAHVEDAPVVDTELEANVVWMADAPLEVGKSYMFKHTATTTPGVVSAINHRVDVNTLAKEPAERLELNQIGHCRVSLARPIAVDPYHSHRHCGAFIIVDRVSNNTVGAGMVTTTAADRQRDFRAEAFGAEAVDVLLRSSLVQPPQRAARVGHGPLTVWFSGPTGSGKRSIAYAVEKRLFDQGFICGVVDGYADGFGHRTAVAARLLNRCGVIGLCASSMSEGEGARLAAELIEAPFLLVRLDVDGRADDAGADLTLATNVIALDECVDRVAELVKTTLDGLAVAGAAYAHDADG